jgi:hypothetical protein
VIVRFFVPAADYDSMAEEVYDTLRRRVGAPPQRRRIWKLAWEHAQQHMECEIGQSMPACYGTEDDPVLAIFDTGSVYFICTIKRGAMVQLSPATTKVQRPLTSQQTSSRNEPPRSSVGRRSLRWCAMQASSSNRRLIPKRGSSPLEHPLVTFRRKSDLVELACVGGRIAPFSHKRPLLVDKERDAAPRERRLKGAAVHVAEHQYDTTVCLPHNSGQNPHAARVV